MGSPRLRQASSRGGGFRYPGYAPGLKKKGRKRKGPSGARIASGAAAGGPAYASLERCGRRRARIRISRRSRELRLENGARPAARGGLDIDSATNEACFSQQALVQICSFAADAAKARHALGRGRHLGATERWHGQNILDQPLIASDGMGATQRKRVSVRRCWCRVSLYLVAQEEGAGARAASTIGSIPIPCCIAAALAAQSRSFLPTSPVLQTSAAFVERYP